MCEKCKWPEGITIKPDGEHELDPCKYVEIAEYKNVTVVVMKCSVCGHIEISWKRQPNSYAVFEEDDIEDDEDEDNEPFEITPFGSFGCLLEEDDDEEDNDEPS